MAGMQTICYSEARSHLRMVLDAVIDDEGIYVVSGMNGRNAVVMSIGEYNGWQDTLHLLATPGNALRLRQARLDLAEGRSSAREASIPRAYLSPQDPKIRFTQGAWDDFNAWGNGDAEECRRVARLIGEIPRHPQAWGRVRTWPLCHDLHGFRSRTIFGQHRLVFRMNEDFMDVVQCRYHY